MEKRRLLSAVIALVMIITSTVTGSIMAYADDVQSPPGVFTILDYGSTPLSLVMGNSRDYYVTDAEDRYGISGYQNYDDWTEFDYVNVQLKVTSFTGDLEKQGFNMIFAGTNNVSGGRYSRVTVYATAEESVFSIPISDLQYGMSFSPTKKHIEYIKFSTSDLGQTLENGVDYNSGSTVSVEKVYLSTAEYGKPLNIVTSTVSDGESQVDPTLGGTRALEFDFGVELIEGDYQEAVEIYEESGDSYVLSDIGYTVSSDGSVLRVELEKDLKSPMIYRVLFKPDILYSVRGASISEEYIMTFAVGCELDIFKFYESTPGDGAEIPADEDFICTLEFNNAVDESQHISDRVLVYIDGIRVFNAYTYEIDDNKLKLKFIDAIEPEKTYTVKVTGKLKNVYGKSLGNDEVMTFTASKEEKESTTIDVFSTADAGAVSMLQGSNWSVDMEECNSNSTNIKMNLTAGRESTVYFYYTGGRIEPAGMNYFNILMYSPAIENRGINCIFYTSRENNKYYRYRLSTDWEGWRLISIPVTSINAGGMDTIDVIMLNMGAWDCPIETNGYIRVEKLWLSQDKPEEPKLLSVNIPEDYADAKINSEFVSFTFDDEILGDSSNITVTDAEGEVFSDYTAVFNKSKINLKFGALELNSEYKITISGVQSSNQGIAISKPIEFSFTTASSGVFVSKLDISKLKQGYRADFGIDNYTEEESTFECIAVAYDENGEIVAYDSTALSVDENSAQDASLELVADNAEYIKAYILNDDGQIVSNRYVTLRNNSISDNDAFDINGSADISIDKADIDINLLTADGTVQGLQNTVILQVAAPDGTIVAKEPVSADDHGKFRYNMVLGEENASGMYVTTAFSGKKSQSKTIGYISSSDRAEFLRLVKAKDTAGIGAWLEKYKAELGISSKSNTQLKDLASMLAEHSYKTYADAHDMLENVLRTLDGFNSSTWTSMWSFIQDNYTVLFEEGSYEYKYLTQNSERTVNNIMSNLAKKVPFATISDFRASLANEIKQIKESETKPQTITGTGGSGSGSGGSSANNSSIVINNDTSVTNNTASEKNIFVDIDGYAWAKASIENLVNKGIVAVGDDSRFRPGDNILREEFVKMIIEAFCSDIYDDGHRFADEKDGMWYNKYLNTAYVNGFVSGHDDGTFGVGECITREDMVTIVCRILENLGNSLDYDMNTAFADSDDISEYAKAYVAAMSNAKVVNGVGNEMFAPKNNATRAEAAVIIAKVIELYK